MQEKELMEFVQWLPQVVEEFQNKTPEEIVATLNDMSKSKEGASMLQEWISKFKSSKKMFRNGGLYGTKLNDEVSIELQNGGKFDPYYGPLKVTDEGYFDVDGREVVYEEPRIKQWINARNERKRLESNALSEAGFGKGIQLDTFNNKPWESITRGVHRGGIYTPADTILTQQLDNGKLQRENAKSLKTFISRKLFGDSKFDKINREYENNIVKKQEGGELRTYVGNSRPIPNGYIGYYHQPTTLTVELPNQTYGYLINKGDTIAFTKPDRNGSLAKRVYNPRERRAIIDHVNSIDQKYGQEDPGLGTKYEWYNKFGERIKVPGQTGLYQRRSDRVDAVWTPKGGVLRVKQPDGTYVYTDNLYDVAEGLYNQDSLKRVFTNLYNSPSTYPEGPKDSKSVKTYKK